jgi:hypothetical protein
MRVPTTATTQLAASAERKSDVIAGTRAMATYRISA